MIARSRFDVTSDDAVRLPTEAIGENAVDEILQRVALFVLASAVGEGISEFFVMPFIDMLRARISDALRQQLGRLWSGALGVLIAWELGTDVFSLLGAQVVHPVVGLVLTGLLFGRGSNWVHEFIKRLVLGNVEKHAAAAMAVRLYEKR